MTQKNEDLGQDSNPNLMDVHPSDLPEGKIHWFGGEPPQEVSMRTAVTITSIVLVFVYMAGVLTGGLVGWFF